MFPAVNVIQSQPFVPNKIRKVILRLAGLTLGKDITLFCSTHFGSSKCTIGDRSFISYNCYIDGSDWVRIGTKVHIGPGTQILTSGHEIGAPEQRAASVTTSPVIIKDGSWIGASCVVLPGVTIASGCVIAAGSLLSKDTLPNGLYMGVPAKRVRDL